jgi:hypothetical protein
MSEVKVNKITPTTDCGTVTLGDSGDTIAIPAGSTVTAPSANITNSGTVNSTTITNSGTLTNSGTITNTGTISGGTISGTLDGSVNWQTTIKTSGFTATAGEGYFVNTTSGQITVTLPASPSAGDIVGVKDYANTADTNKIIIGRNGSNIQGIANNFEITTEGLAIILLYVDATKGWLSVGQSKASDITEQVLFVTATGGTVTTSGDYKIHVFTGPGTFCVSCAGGASGSDSVDYMVLAGGGGGGGGSGGGGGAGGFRESHSTPVSGPYTASPLATPTALTVSVQGYPITVGAGGGGPGDGGTGGAGSNSIFSSITSAGGGGGTHAGPSGTPGGSGGGAGYGGPATGGTGNTPPVSPPQGNPGGANPSPSVNPYNGAGGGGAASAGNPRPAGKGGGSGVTTSITGSPVTRAGGGGGSAGGSGGGGGAGSSTPSGGTAASANTGSGGGAGPGVVPSGVFPGGGGGSGIVAIRYKFQ